MKLPDLSRYKEEKKAWQDAGEPVRSDEEVVQLYDICAACEHFIKLPLLPDRGQCGICTCLLSKDADRMNKLRWATTSCPLDPPKWGTKKEAEPEVPVQPQFNQRKRKGGGGNCGCGA